MRLPNLLLLLLTPAEDALCPTKYSNSKALLIHIVCVCWLNVVFGDFLLQQVKVQLVLVLRLSVVATRVHTHHLLRGELVTVTAKEARNPAIGARILSNCRGKIAYHRPCGW